MVFYRLLDAGYCDRRLGYVRSDDKLAGASRRLVKNPLIKLNRQRGVQRTNSHRPYFIAIILPHHDALVDSLVV